MRIGLILAVLAGSILSAAAQEKNLQYYYSRALEFRKNKDYPAFYEMIIQAGKLHPYHQGIQYMSGIACAVTGRKEEAFAFLRSAIQTNASFDLMIEDLKSLHGSAGFESLKALQAELNTPVIRSDTAFMLYDRALHPEGIAVYGTTVYATSIRKNKIVKITPDLTVSDFIETGRDGITSVLGIRIDAQRKVLWASASPHPFSENYDSTAVSGVYKYDLASGNLLAKYHLPQGTHSLWGDLTLNGKGEVFISDSQTNTVYKLNEKDNCIETYFTSPELWSLQGIAFSDDERYLFLADYVKGVFRLDTKNKTLVLLENTSNESVKGIDGLLWYNRSLIALQNATTPMKVTRYFFNPEFTALTQADIIDRGHPAFNEPTNGCIVNGTLYYIANSQWNGYTKENQLKPLHELQDIVILKANLNR